MCLSSQLMLWNINSLPVKWGTIERNATIGWNLPFQPGSERPIPAWVGTHHSSLGWNVPIQPGLERTIHG